MDVGHDTIDTLFASVRRVLGEESSHQLSSSSSSSSISSTTDDTNVRQSTSSRAGAAVTARKTPPVAAAAAAAVAQRTDPATRCAMGAMVENGFPAGSSSNLGAAGCAVLGQAKARRVLASAAGARRGGRVHSSTHETVLHNAIEKNAEETLRDLSERRQHADMARRARLAHMAARRDAFGHLAECRLAQARAQSLAKTRRLLLQSADSTRRLQELLHECVGEYEKARLRGARRRRLSAEACDSVLAGKILDLRWSRFCSRLEEDSLGLVVARDLGDPTAIKAAAGDPPHPTSVAARGGDAAAAAAATKVASLVAPLLASRGLGDARVLRVVALSPCSGSGDGGPGSTSADSHRRRSRGFGPGTVDDNGGGRALSHGGQRRGDGRVAGGGGDVVRALREAAVQSEKAGGENVSASAAAVLAVPAGSSPPAVADVIRRAILCANGVLATALMSCKDGDDDAAVSESRRHGSSGGDRVAFRSIPGGPRRWSAVVAPPDASVVGKGSPASCKGSSSAKRTGREGGGGGSGGGSGCGTRCTVVEAEPGLLLSSSHLLWTLRPPFDTNAVHDGHPRRGSGGGGGGGSADASSGAAGEEAREGASPRSAADSTGDGGSGGWAAAATTGGGGCGAEARARSGGRGSSIGGGGGGGRRRELDREVAWIGAAPVGSRVYYCLEEAEWEASRWRRRRERELPSSSPFPVTTTPERDEGSPPPQSAVGGGDAACDGAGGGHADRKGGGGQARYTEGAGNAGSENDRTAASVFAKSVSAMLAETYLGPKPRCPAGNAEESRLLEREEGSAQSERLVTSKHEGSGSLLRATQAAVSAEEEGTVAGVRGGDKHLGGSFSGAFVGGGEGGCASALSFVVSGTVDDHRKRGRLKAAPDGGGADDDRPLEALASVPDVLVVLVAGAGAERPIGDQDNRRTGDHSSRETLTSGGERGGLGGSGSSPVPPAAGASTANAAAATATPPTPPRRRLHFAPAGVLQLLGTPHCREFVKALPPPARARVLALTQAFPDGTLPPIGHLYVPLAPALPGKDTLTASAAAAAGVRPAIGTPPACFDEDGGAAGQWSSGAEGEGPGGKGGTGSIFGCCPSPAAVAPPPLGCCSAGEAEAAGSGPPLLGALVQPLPARAVRELLQIYVATTRAVGEAEGGSGGGGARRRRRRRTSGLLAVAPPPPPPTPLTARGRGVVRSGCDDDAGTDDGGHAKSRRWSSGGPPGREERSPGESGGCSGAGGGDRANLAATPPSAVDVLPDEPPTSSSAPPVGIGRPGARPAAPSCPGDGVEGADGGPTGSGGEVPGDNVEDDAEAAGSARRRTPLCSTADSGADAPISSSLRAPFRHTYVAVLAPPPAQPPSPFSSSAGSGGSGDGNGQSATTNKSRGGGGGRGQPPLSGASALILQLEPPLTAAGSPWSSFGAVQDRGPCGAATAMAGRGNGGGTVVVGGMGGARGGGGGGAGCEMPRRVCGWRACLADAVAGPLCPVHLELRDFLDGKAAKTGGVSDAFRFLPPGSGPKRRSSLRKRRAAAAAAAAVAATDAGTARVAAALSALDGGGEGELAVMRSMSPLLAELLNGKLGTTIAMFCRRVAAEARAPRRRGSQQQQQQQQQQEVRPEWARWADPEEVKAADRKLEADTRWAEKVLRAEKEVTLELRRLSNLEVYPAAELAHIRREHRALATEWQQVIGKDATDDEHGRLCVVGEDDDEGDLVGGGGGLLPRPNAAAIGSRNGVATAAQPPSLLAMLLPPSGTKRRRKEMALAPFNAATAGEDAAAAAAAAAPGGVSLSGPLTATGAGGASGANSGGNAADKRPDGHRQRWKGYGGGGNGGASIAGSRAPPGVRGKVKGASGIGGSGGPGKEEALGSQSENRGEQEIELEFSRLKWALFRRRRQEAEIPRMVARGHGHQTLVPPLGAMPPVLSTAGGAGGGGGSGSSRHLVAGRDGGGRREAAGTPLKPVSSSPLSLEEFPALPAEEQLYQLSPISALLTRASGRRGGGSGRRLREKQKQQQQQHQRVSRLPLKASSPKPAALPSATAVATATAFLGRRHSSPPRVGALAASAAHEGPASSGQVSPEAVSSVPTAATGRAMRGGVVTAAASHGTGKGNGERGKGGGGRAVPGRVVSRRRTFGAGGGGTAAAAAAGGELRGFDAAPYQSSVHFRDR